ncbi:hypothetical protein PG994_007986 [Apiospora phragmitis]|uniref:Phosphorylcholine phosphatase n=1 Tax=Apiospora phragmitis TaxID=2905665 RepID=A0ABR1URS5_9PEZI
MLVSAIHNMSEGGNFLLYIMSTSAAKTRACLHLCPSSIHNMRCPTRVCAAAAALGLAASAAAAPLTTSRGSVLPELQHWPRAAAESLTTMIRRNANSSNYAVFDMDNTSYRWDLEESIIPFLENKGVLTRDTLDPSLKLIPFHDTAAYNETLYSYYQRLCAIDEFVCYPWAAQVFAGLTLRELKGHVDELMALNGTAVPTSYWDDDGVVATNVSAPQVYVVSASNEELVRMVASDPRYGYNVKPENVIGVTTMLRDPADPDTLTNSRMQIRAGTYDAAANLERNLVVGPYLWSPETWYAGKWSAILTYINEWKKPILVGGDSPGSDTYMLFHGVDVAKGGVHLWINRSESKYQQLQTMIGEAAKGQQRNGLEVTVDKNWVVVTPEEIL